MLFFIAPDPVDLKVVDAKTWRERLFKIVYAACDQLHPKGTVVALVPQPYYDHANVIAGECLNLRSNVVPSTASCRYRAVILMLV